jgi:hypothetical protein
MLLVTGEASNVFESADPTYVEAGQTSVLKAIQNKQIRTSTSFPFIEYVTTRDFMYFTADPVLTYKSGFTPDENVSYSFGARGSYKAVVVALDDEVKQVGPFGE